MSNCINKSDVLNFLPGSNSCSNNNGGCAHLCLPYPGGRTCRCGQGFYTVDVTSCAPLPSCPAEKQSCPDGSRCLSSSQFCDGHVDCEDGSDEQDCELKSCLVKSEQLPVLCCQLHFHIISNADIQCSFLLTGPYTNIALSGTEGKEVPTAKSSSSSSVEKAEGSCDLQCNGHGSCVTEGTVNRCHCMAGYKGDFCQETETRQSHVALGLGLFCLFAVLITAIFLYVKRY